MNAQPRATSAAAVPPRTLSESQRARLLAYVGLKPQKAYRLLDIRSQSAEDRRLVADALRKAGFPPSESKTEDGGLIPQSVGPDGYVRFVDIMTDGNLRIAHRLMTEQYPKADLFVHHMMDMEIAYSEKPQFQFDEQMLRMGRLDRRLPGEFAGRLIHFVAFDPFAAKRRWRPPYAVWSKAPSASSFILHRVIERPATIIQNAQRMGNRSAKGAVGLALQKC